MKNNHPHQVSVKFNVVNGRVFLEAYVVDLEKGDWTPRISFLTINDAILLRNQLQDVIREVLSND